MGTLTNNRGSGGIGFFGLLAVVFIALKVTNYITWPWWLVTAPIWGGLALLAVVLIFTVALAAFVSK